MKVAIIGSGKMAKGISTRLLIGGHNVILHVRDLEKANALAAELRQLVNDDTRVKVKLADDLITDDIIILAVPYSEVAKVIEQYGDQLSGRILVDITNPTGQTFELVTPLGSSAAEEIAKLAPKARVVKAFNTTFAGTLVQGQVNGQPLDVFIASDDAEAKATIAKLVENGGLRAIDVGPLRRAHNLEAFQLIHIYLNLQKELGLNFMSTVKLLS